MTMALSPIKLFLVVFICLWQVCYLSSTCPEKCTCHNNLTSTQICSFNVTLKENANVYHVSVCCGDEGQAWRPELANRSLPAVTVRCSACSGRAPAPAAYSLAVVNNTVIKIKINVNIQSLLQMDLSNNRLISVTKGLFNNFTYLQTLIISKNEITSISPGSFNGLSKLESLDLSENKLTILTNVFTPLKNLQHLNLSRNNIEFINENYFNNWLLQHLDVSHNNLKKMAPGALQLLPNLARLLLTDNPRLGAPRPPAQLLLGAGRRLQQIDASRTGLCQVPEAFTHSVRFLSLQGNNISSIRCGDLDSYPLLQSLDFSDNKIVSVEDDSLGRLEMLLFLNVNKNILTTIPKSLPDELKYLSVSNNFIRNLSAHDFQDLLNLRILLLQNNQIRYIEDHVFDDLLSLEMLDLSNNPIQTLSSNTFDGPLSLRDLRLCYLNLSVPAQDGAFPVSSPESVQMLHLQASPGLARQLLADSAALAAFTHLQYLDLRMNNLSEIRNDLLYYLVQLKTLRLHGNSINCSAKTWLKDWMNWNKSTSNGESCYYSTSEAKEEINKYNCTYPETFTISESLPPVNLYSTEMINKLLRYYGYLTNNTDKDTEPSKRDENKHNSGYDYNSKLNKTYAKYTKHMNSSISQKDARLTKTAFKLSFYDFLNETTAVKSRESSKILEQNKLLHDQFHVDQRFLDSEPNLTPPVWRDTKKGKDDVISEIRQNNKSGKRLNTPVEAKKVLKTKLVKNESLLAVFSNVTRIEIGPGIPDENQSTNANEKSEFSPFQSPHTNYAQYIGTVAVSVLIVMSLILWISFRLRYKRRRPPIVEAEAEDQIEVSNISGRVLW